VSEGIATTVGLTYGTTRTQLMNVLGGTEPLRESAAHIRQ
jgi:hypothetical protein